MITDYFLHSLVNFLLKKYWFIWRWTSTIRSPTVASSHIY